MRTVVISIVFAMLTPTIAHGGDWRVGVASGPFIFGDFAERTSRITNGVDTIRVTSSLSAETRAGVAVDLERSFNDRFSLRLDATFTRAPLAIKTESNDDDDPDEDGVSLTVGEMDATTLALTFAWRFNRGGRIRPYLFAGPAWVLYDFDRNEKTGAIPIFEGTRERAAIVAGGGAEWWISDRFALRGELSDTYSEAPLEESDFSGVRSVEIEEPHHVHTTVGVKYRF